MNIKNAVYKDIRMQWDGITMPLRAGTPISLAGQIANGSTAVGIVPQTITERPVLPYTPILVGGDVELAEAEIEYGGTISAEAVKAMDGIRFFDDTGTIVPAPGTYVLPDATETALGGVKMAANVAEADGEAPTAAEFKALLDALIDAGIMAAAAED